MIGFIGTLYTALGTTGNYSAIGDLHTFQFTVTHALGFFVSTSLLLATHFITVSLSLQLTHEVFFSQSNSFLSIILQLPVPKTRLNLIASSHSGRQAFRNSTLLDRIAQMNSSL
jgi:hypothetical protein